MEVRFKFFCFTGRALLSVLPASLLLFAAAAAILLSFPLSPVASSASPGPPAKANSPASDLSDTPKTQCELNAARGDIQHLIFIQFGSLHFLRDNPNVPSDLEQMPHLLAFLERNGALLTNHHAAVSSSNSDASLTSLTGLYPDAIPSAKSALSPWLPFTRAGCNVGAIGVSGMTLENASANARKVFGTDSLEAALAAEPSRSAQTAADLEGIAIHCAAGNSLCATGKPDTLAGQPSPEPSNALVGHRNVAPALNLADRFADLDGKVVSDAQANPGFPGFARISAAQSLAYVAAMQEHGVPITYAFIASPHDNHSGAGSFGPGEAGYVAQLKAYDAAFDKFLTRLSADGIDQNNTLFVVTALDSGHFVGGPPLPSTCDGVSIPCSYPKAGAIVANLGELLVRKDSKLAVTSFDLTPGSAPEFFLKSNPLLGSEAVRRLEKTAAKLTAISPITGNPDQLAVSLADSVGLKLLHLTPGQPSHSPNFVLFGHPDYLFLASGTPAPVQNRDLLWNRSAIDTDTTFLALVGPGVNVKGVDKDLWSDQADARPTLLALVGLTDDYPTQGRGLAELFHPWACPKGIQDASDPFLQLAQAYKQINAPLGELGATSLQISTAALSGDDPKFDNLERQLQAISALRDDLAQAISNVLNAAEFHGRRISDEEARQLTRSANDLVEYAKLVAANGW